MLLFLSKKIELLLVGQSSIASITVSVSAKVFTRDSKISKTAFISKLLLMLGNMFTISKPTTIDSDGKFNLSSSSTKLSTFINNIKFRVSLCEMVNH